MRFIDSWFIGIDDEYRQYLNILFSACVLFILIILTLITVKHLHERAKFTEIYYAMADLRVDVQEYYGYFHELPSDELLQALINKNGEEIFTSRHIRHFTFSQAVALNGAIILTFVSSNEEINGSKLSIQPYVDASIGTVFWRCGYASLPDKFEAGLVDTPTSLPRKFLTSMCQE